MRSRKKTGNLEDGAESTSSSPKSKLNTTTTTNDKSKNKNKMQKSKQTTGKGKDDGLEEQLLISVLHWIFFLFFISLALMIFTFFFFIRPPTLDRSTQMLWEQRAESISSFVSTSFSKSRWPSKVAGVVPYHALHFVSCFKNNFQFLSEPLIRFVVYLGANVSAIDSRGSTALHYAARHGNMEAIRTLIDLGADIYSLNAEKESPAELLAVKYWERTRSVRKAVGTLERERALSRWKKQRALGKEREMESRTVDRYHKDDLPYEKFINEYAMKKKPVIILGYMNQTLNGNVWNREHLGQHCGSRNVKLRTFDSSSTDWANLLAADSMKFSKWLSLSREEANQTMVFDWSLPINCPSLMREFTMPKYFAEDYIQHTQFRRLRKSWPSLFIAHNGTKSGLHVDAYGSNFWMLVLEGHKQWRFFHHDEKAFLYPNLDSYNFFPDVYNPDYKKYPLLSSTTAYDTVIGPGDLLFVPGGVPHQVRNLDDNIAISGNYIDNTCFDLSERDLLIHKLMGTSYREFYDMLMEVDRTIPWDQQDLPYADYRKGYWVDGEEVNARGETGCEDEDEYESDD